MEDGGRRWLRELRERNAEFEVRKDSMHANFKALNKSDLNLKDFLKGSTY